MKNKVGIERSSLTFVMIGFLLFSALFLFLTNGVDFKIKADTNTVPCFKQLPVTYIPTSLRTDQTLKQRDYQAVQTIFNKVCTQQRAAISITNRDDPQPDIIQGIITDDLTRYDQGIKDDKNSVVDGLYIGQKKTLYILASTLESSNESNLVIAHELIHSFQSDQTSDLDYIQEGETEYFARKLYPVTGAYDFPVKTIKSLIDAINRLDVVTAPDRLGEKHPLTGENFLSRYMFTGKLQSNLDSLLKPYMPEGQKSAYYKINYALKQEADGKYHEDIIAWLNSIKPKTTKPVVTPLPTTKPTTQPVDNPDTQVSPAPQTSYTPNRFIIITGPNCPKCQQMEPVISQLMNAFETEVNEKKLAFVTYDWDKNNYFGKTITLEGDLPVIILKKDAQEVGRYTQLQSKEALAQRIQDLIDMPPSANKTISNLVVKEENNKLIISANVTGDVDRVIIKAMSTNGKYFEELNLKPSDNSFRKVFNLGTSVTLKDKIIDNFSLPKANAQAEIFAPALGPLAPVVTVFTVAKDTVVGWGQSGDTSKLPQDGTGTNQGTGGTSAVNNSGGLAVGLGSLYDSLIGLSTSDPSAKGDNYDQSLTNIEARIVNIFTLLFAIASAALVFAAIYSGLMYIFSMGNEEQANKAKKNFANLIMGLIILLSSFTIVTIIRNIITSSHIGG